MNNLDKVQINGHASIISAVRACITPSVNRNGYFNLRRVVTAAVKGKHFEHATYCSSRLTKGVQWREE